MARNIKFSKSERKGKKYDVEFTYKGKKHKVSFGALGYEQWKDQTPLKLYSYMDHGDPKRRELYYKRHGQTSDPLSAKYWSNRYLW